MDTTSFKIDTADYLSINYSAFRDDMLELALSKPSDYFRLRKAVLQAVKKSAVENIYTIYYNLLTTGTDPAGNNILTGGGAADLAGIFKPSYPKQLVNKFALGASETIDKIAEDAVELLLPRNYKDIANERTSTKGKASGIDV